MFFSPALIADSAREAPARSVAVKLDRLRTELADMAFVLDRRGHPEAADVAMTISARVGEMIEEIAQDDLA